MSEESGLLVFDSTNMALKAERLLRGAGVILSVIPTPLDITAECGIALLIRCEWAEKAAAVLDTSDNIRYKIIYPYEQNRSPG